MDHVGWEKAFASAQCTSGRHSRQCYWLPTLSVHSQILVGRRRLMGTGWPYIRLSRPLPRLSGVCTRSTTSLNRLDLLLVISCPPAPDVLAQNLAAVCRRFRSVILTLSLNRRSGDVNCPAVWGTRCMAEPNVSPPRCAAFNSSLPWQLPSKDRKTILRSIVHSYSSTNSETLSRSDYSVHADQSTYFTVE